jgi:4-hydroxy-tetrahydrodipicolinate reductase
VKHVGFTQSIGMIADALGWRLDRITETIAPKMATETVTGDLLAVDAGYVAGVVQDGIGYVKSQPVITLHLEAYLGAPKSYDSIEIVGSPMLSLVFEGGIHGDIATASMVVNAIPRVLSAPAGLHTMRDINLPSYWNGARV